MKQSPELKTIQDNMLDGSMATYDFLGTDTRNLADILHDDDTVVEILGLSHESIAKRLRYFTSKGLAHFGQPVVVDGIYETVVEEHKGSLPCPFRDNYTADKSITRVTNVDTGLSIVWSDLNIHMIEHHGFYEGKGARFRVDPKNLAETLALSGDKE